MFHFRISRPSRGVNNLALFKGSFKGCGRSVGIGIRCAPGMWFCEVSRGDGGRKASIFYRVIPYFYFVFRLVLQLFSTRPSSRLVFSTITPYMVQRYYRYYRHSRQYGVAMREVSRYFRLAYFSLGRSTTFRRTFFTSFLFRLYVFGSIMELGRTQVIRALRAVGSQPTRGYCATNVFPCFGIYVGLTSLRQGDGFCFVVFPRSLGSRVSFFRVYDSVLLFSVCACLGEAQTCPK